MKKLLSLVLVAFLATATVDVIAQDDKKCNKACCTKKENCEMPCKKKCSKEACAKKNQEKKQS
ncbi:MAG TPA: hypothetical protein VD996_18010 [Chitinophagaceae bacterium]|nr:hypothetical protein [Chitinophagaceae bacterium]